MKPVPSFAHLSDADLTAEVSRLVHAERASSVSLVASLAEFDRRKLSLAAGFSSLFTYCRDHLHLGDGAAYRRIEAARAARRFPVILDMLADGRVSLTTVTLLAPHLTAANHRALLDEATHLSTRKVERIVARLRPLPDVPATVRKLPIKTEPALDQGHTPQFAPVAREVRESSGRENVIEETPTAKAAATPLAFSRPVIAPLSPERYKLQITMDQDTYDKLREVQALMRHSIPSGDVGIIIGRALTCLLRELLKRKTGARNGDFSKEDDPKRPEKGGHAGLFH